MGWLKNNAPFNGKLFFYTLVRTSIIGAMIGYGTNQDPILVFFEVYFADTIVNPVIDKSYKTVKKNNG